MKTFLSQKKDNFLLAFILPGTSCFQMQTPQISSSYLPLAGSALGQPWLAFLLLHFLFDYFLSLLFTTGTPCSVMNRGPHYLREVFIKHAGLAPLLSRTLITSLCFYSKL